MKKQMAIVMAGAMAMTTIPMNVFAATNSTAAIRYSAVLNGNSTRSNSILVATSGAGLTLADLKAEFDTRVEMNDEGYDVIGAPVILLSEITATKGAQFDVILSNGKWFNKDYFNQQEVIDIVKAYDGNAGFDIAINPIYSNRITVTITEDWSAKSKSIKLPILATVGNSDALTVSIKPLDESSNITATTLTAATVNNEASSGNTTTKVSTFTGKNELKMAITTSENNPGVFGSGFLNQDKSSTASNHPAGVYGEGVEKVTYTITRGFKFVDYKDFVITDSWAKLNPSIVKSDYDLQNVKFDVWARLVDDNKMEVIYDFSNNLDANGNIKLSTNASSVKISDIGVVPTRTTALGTEAFLTITPNTNSAISDASGIKAGTYISYGHSAELGEKTYPTLPAGSLGFTPIGISSGSGISEDKNLFDTDIVSDINKNDNFDEYHKTAPMKVSENIKGAMIEKRTLEFVLPEGVEIVGYKITNVKKFNLNDDIAYNEYVYTDNLPSGAEIDDNILSFDSFLKTNTASDDAGSFYIQFFVAADANFSGNVDVVVTGDAIANETLDAVTVAKIEPAFTVEAKLNNVKAGVQTTPTSDIVITEVEAGNFQDKETVKIWIDTKNTATLENALNITAADIKVTSGDLTIKNVKVEKGAVTFDISGQSSKASTIELSNVKVSTAYGLPETNDYPFDIAVATDAGSEAKSGGNVESSKSIKFGELRTDYVNITNSNGITGSALNGAVVQVQPGSTTYLVDGVEKTMDVAPFIDPATNSTMVPVRFIADGVGLTEEDGNLIWSAGNRTVILRNGTEIIEFPVDCNYYRVNGVTIYNDNNAVTQIVNDRTFVPFRTMGTALGVPVEWNATTGIAQYN